MTTKYISSKETAALIRTQLKKNFPGVKFYVRSDHNSINIDWINGPSTKAVETLTNSYQGGGFDGMIDLEYSISSWLLPDGTAIHAHSEGAEDSRGSVPGTHNAAPDGAIEVHFGATYIFINRHYTADYAKPIIKAVCDEYGKPEPTYYVTHFYAGNKVISETFDWNCMDPNWGDMDHFINAEIRRRLNGEQPEETPAVEAAPEVESVKIEEPKTTEPLTISISYDRDWTWIKVPAQDDEALRNILTNTLKARWSFRRLAWFIMETVEEAVIFNTLQPQVITSTASNRPCRYNLMDEE